MPNNKDCIYCKIIARELPCYKIYEDPNIVAFLDINPFVIGHLLVVPKEHSRWLWDMNSNEYLILMEKTKYLSEVLKKAFKTDWIEAVVAGIGVQHTHIHLLPRQFNDGLGELPTKTLLPKPSKEKMEKIAEKIIKFL